MGWLSGFGGWVWVWVLQMDYYGYTGYMACCGLCLPVFTWRIYFWSNIRLVFEPEGLWDFVWHGSVSIGIEWLFTPLKISPSWWWFGVMMNVFSMCIRLYLGVWGGFLMCVSTMISVTYSCYLYDSFPWYSVLAILFILSFFSYFTQSVDLLSFSLLPFFPCWCYVLWTGRFGENWWEGRRFWWDSWEWDVLILG